MATILALDTATERLSAALARDGRVVDALTDAEPNQHTEKLISVIDAILQRNALALSELDAVAFGAGPGAFTGLRVACGVAQGLGWAAGKPLLCVSNLEATARHAAAAGFVGRLLAAHDARMHECYAAVFEIGPAAPGVPAGLNAVKTLAAAQLVKPSMLGALAREHAVEAAAGGALEVYGGEIVLDAGVRRLAPFDTTASDIALGGMALWEAGGAVRPEEAAPLYVRNRVALTMAERAAGERL